MNVWRYLPPFRGAPIWLLVGMVVAGCAAPGPSGSPTTTPSPAEPGVTAASAHSRQQDECLVCKYNADLACVNVRVDKTTPTYVFNGRTYYFCSDECRDDFKKNPEKYLAQK
jgi:YHS domain-containing protein